MKVHLRYGFACLAVLTLLYVLSLPAGAQDTIKVMPPGGPAPRMADGHPDFSGLWLPNSAGQGVSGRFGVDPLARRQFDPKVTPEEPPSFQPWALAKIKAMTPTELELSKSSVNCMPRGVPAIWLSLRVFTTAAKINAESIRLRKHNSIRQTCFKRSFPTRAILPSPNHAGISAAPRM